MRRLAAFASAILLLAACSSDDSGSDTTAAPSAPDTTVVVDTTAESAPDTTAAPTTVEATTTTEPPQQYAATIDELLALGRPIVLAHTAGEDEFPASSLFAFGESVKAGVDMLDMNVLLTKDGVLIVQHDDTVDRVTNGTGAVAQLHQHKQAIGRQCLAQAVGDGRDLVVEAGRGDGRRQGDRPLLDAHPLQVAQQQIIELLLSVGQGDVEKATSDVELRPVLQQPGRGAHVANRRRVIGQPAGVLIDAQQQQRRLFRG